MSKYLATAVLAVALVGCSALTPMLDEKTKTNRAQRCVDYRGAVAMLTFRESQGALNKGEVALLEAARAGIMAYCPGVGAPPASAPAS